MTSTTERSRLVTEEQLRQLTRSIEQGARGPILAEHLLAAAAQVLRLNELELMVAEAGAGTHRDIVRAAWADSRACRVTMTDGLMPMVAEAKQRRILAEEYIQVAA